MLGDRFYREKAAGHLAPPPAPDLRTVAKGMAPKALLADICDILVERDDIDPNELERVANAIGHHAHIRART